MLPFLQEFTRGQEFKTYLSESRMVSFWAKALQRDVFPVPGGPER